MKKNIGTPSCDTIATGNSHATTDSVRGTTSGGPPLSIIALRRSNGKTVETVESNTVHLI
ncbi:hypothetical protein OCU04_012659 [Sclerotinia nivalis]|uniref:Uncharacterized protein n=1 Tax=Sclerotinia nivalis TaxID=352851 RepID=A0A9X0DCL4_9HELO|nr:hypothetical protein OCU04_012659 [Sclerotinia nivalis]